MNFSARMAWYQANEIRPWKRLWHGVELSLITASAMGLGAGVGIAAVAGFLILELQQINLNG